MRVALIMCLFAFEQWAQPASQQPPSPRAGSSETQLQPEDLCSLEGQVINAVTGAPVNKASVLLSGVSGTTGKYSTASDVRGKYAMAQIPAGTYRLRVFREGFVDSEYGAKGPLRLGTRLILEPAKHLSEVNVRSTPQSVISGRIFDEEGDPVARVEVQLWQRRYVRGKKQLQSAASASTNDLGQYRIYGLTPGTYYLSAIRRPSTHLQGAEDRSAKPAPEEDFLPTYYPGTGDFAGAAQLDVPAAAELPNVSLKLVRGHIVRLRGTVVNSATEGRAGITVLLMPAYNPAGLTLSKSVMADTKGNFDIRGVPPGPYVLRASFTQGGKGYAAQFPLDVGRQNIDNIRVNIGTGVPVSGRLRIDGEGAEALNKFVFALMPRTTVGVVFDVFRGQPPDEKGNFKLTGVTPNVYDIVMNRLPEGYYVKAIRSGETNVLASGFSVGQSEPELLEIVLGSDGGQAAGTVQDADTGRPAVGATVVLVPVTEGKRAHESFYAVGTSDPKGRFSLRNVEPGDYKVYAWEDAEAGAWMDPDFVASFEAKAEKVTIRPETVQQLRLKLIPAGR